MQAGASAQASMRGRRPARSGPRQALRPPKAAKAPKGPNFSLSSGMALAFNHFRLRGGAGLTQCTFRIAEHLSSGAPGPGRQAAKAALTSHLGLAERGRAQACVSSLLRCHVSSTFLALA